MKVGHRLSAMRRQRQRLLRREAWLRRMGRMFDRRSISAYLIVALVITILWIGATRARWWPAHLPPEVNRKVDGDATRWRP